MIRSRGRALAAAVAVFALAAGCDAPEPEGPAGSTPAATFDLPGIRESGRLRILSLRSRTQYLPRAGSPADLERKLAGSLAEELGLEAEFIGVDSLDQLIPALLEGRGDLAIDNLTATEERRRQVAFSAPFAYAREQLVTRADDDALAREADLSGRRIAVKRSSAFWSTAERLAGDVEDVHLEPVPEGMEIEEIMRAVERGRFDVTILDSNWIEPALAWHPGLRVAFDVGEDQIIAWAMRPGARELRKAVDGFLARAHLGGRRTAELFTGDLAEIEERGVLRVLTRNSATTYFIWRGEILGFEYELVEELARQRGLRLEMVVPPSRDDLIPWLLAGRGDVVAAGLTASPERARAEGVAFTRATNVVRETVVARADDTSIASVADLGGRRFHVRRSSSYWQTLAALRAEGIGLELVAAPEELETEQIIARVASGDYDLTLADSHVLDVELTWRQDVRAALELGEPVEHGWVVRPDAPDLLAALDEFLKAEYRGLFYNVIFDRYFVDRRRILEHVELRASRNGRISPWDAVVRRHAAQHGFDWRLVVSQMYQESRFDPQARSFAGARGLLQIMPRTARSLGLEDIDDPETGIRAGVRYLAWTRDRFEPELSAADRTWFALAAYNVGPGHVADARILAAERELDPDRWFGNVERAMLWKEQRAFHKRTRFGYCRGSEPVRYVRAIADRYDAYVQVAAKTRDPLPASPAP